MTISEWLLLGGAAVLIHSGLKKEAADKQEESDNLVENLGELLDVAAENRKNTEELNRCNNVNTVRRSVPCSFKDGLSYDEFNKLAHRAGRKIKRIKTVSVDGGKIYCKVESQSGISCWDFSVDFNDWGHVTGTYWPQTDNYDSSIPSHFGHMVSGWVHDIFEDRGIILDDLSDFVDKNKDLGTDKALSYYHKNSFFKKLFIKDAETITIPYSSDELIGEHVYPVISILKDSGFNVIKTSFIQDANDINSYYPYEVKQVNIAGITSFDYGMSFDKNSEIEIIYHEKQIIKMPFSEGELRRKDFTIVGDQLAAYGFTNIYERKIEDIITGWFVKEGTVERVLIEGKPEVPILKNAEYEYDQKIIICYHTKKK